MAEVRTEFVHTGESASLYNCSLSPGFTEADVKLLRLALIKFGIGKWSEIVASGFLPGKTPAQLNLQTQRLLGQQSTAEFMGLHIDPDKVRMENAKKQGPDVKRKNGCVVNSGNKMRREDIREKMKLNTELYGVAEEVWKNIDIPVPDVKQPSGNGEASPVQIQEIETDSEAPYTSDSDTDAEDASESGSTEEKGEEGAAAIAALRLELEQDLASLETLVAKRREVRALLKEVEGMRSKLEKAAAPTPAASFAKPKAVTNRQASKKQAAKTAKPSKASGKAKAQKRRKSDDEDAEEEGEPVASAKPSRQQVYNEDEEDTTCICFRGYQEGENMLDCDSCHKWHHNECVGAPEDISEDVEWLCPECCP